VASAQQRKLRDICEPVINSLGLELVEITYTRQNGQRVVEITIDGPEGISHIECEKVTRAVEGPLDEADLIPESYLLQVSSPGLDRPLITREHYLRFCGNDIRVKTYQPIDGQRNFKGVLLGLEGDDVVLDILGKQVKLPLEQITRARLDPRF
jgi:ribosome maturation factor RimP